MLLVLTNSLDATADYLLSHLLKASVPFLRLDTDSALSRIALSYQDGKPALKVDGHWYEPNDFTSVWYRRPERLLLGNATDTPEGRCVVDEWSEALEGFLAHIPAAQWMNYPAANAQASKKLEQLSMAQKHGFAIPETIVTQDPKVLRDFFNTHTGEIIVKPMGRASVERPDDGCDSLIYTNRVRESDIEDLTDLPQCPTLFQQAIRKVSDIRITVVDADIHAVELIAKDVDGHQRCDIRRNNMQDVAYRMIDLPASAKSAVRNLMSFYGLRFAAIDMAKAENDQWYFFEVNPNGQWAWLDLCAGTTIYKSFIVSFLRDLK